jgi:hypothetical protein
MIRHAQCQRFPICGIEVKVDAAALAFIPTILDARSLQPVLDPPSYLAVPRPRCCSPGILEGRRFLLSFSSQGRLPL